MATNELRSSTSIMETGGKFAMVTIRVIDTKCMQLGKRSPTHIATDCRGKEFLVVRSRGDSLSRHQDKYGHLKHITIWREFDENVIHNIIFKRA